MDVLPDVRDGLTRLERMILLTLHELKAEFGDRPVSSVMIYGRVVEKLDASPSAVVDALIRLKGKAPD
ncbi:MAG: hypothetical protein HY791_36700 [Deltaproteobacteria bacterium]|nr:hypothetical protein [Deltaproteobacteria bacterium]